jgi:hypothetical protein
MRRKRERHNYLKDALAEICQLHDEIREIGFTALRASLPLAIRIGEKLYRIREGHKAKRWRKGEWLNFVKTLPFSQRSAYNYIGFYERRDELELQGIATLSEAMRLLYPPQPKLVSGTEEAESDPGTETALPMSEQASADGQASEEQPVHPQKRRKSLRRILHEISPAQLTKDLGRTHDAAITGIVAKMKEWNYPCEPFAGYGARMIEHGKALIEHGERWGDGSTLKTSRTTLASEECHHRMH